MKKLLLIFLGLTVLIMYFGFMRPFRLSGDCMEPAFMDKQIYFLNKITPAIRGYKEGDVILFNHEDKIWISRIIALESSVVKITEENIEVDGIQLKDNVTRNWLNWNYGDYAINSPLKVPSKNLFVLSDNLCCKHDDSRVFGPIAEAAVIGLAW